VTEGLVRTLLRLAPEEFRSRWEDELLAVHRRRAGEPRDPLRAVAFTLRELGGTAWLVLRLRLGGIGSAGERHPDGTTTTTGGGTMLEHIRTDLRFAARGLMRNPGFTLAAVVVLALGIGANTAIFSAANAYFFRPLPFAGEESLVTVFETNPDFGWTHAMAAPANVLDWRDQVEAFQDVAFYRESPAEAVLLRDGEPEVLSYTQVSGNFFDVAGVPAELGRSFRWEETWDGADDIVVLSHQAWTRRFGGDPQVVGRMLELGSRTVEVVGVMPASFSFPASSLDLWTPYGWDPSSTEAAWFRRAHFVRPLARLVPGSTFEEAAAQLQVVVARLARDYPATNEVMGAGLMPVRTFLIREVRTPLLILLGAVGVLLVLAAVNVANLVLVRSADRTREVALRRALGAGRGRVARLMATESLLLAFLGGGAGLALGWAGVHLMRRLTPLGIDGATTAALDHRVVLVAGAAAALSAVLFGLAPVLRTAGGRIHETLRSGGRGGSGGRRALRGVRTLVVAEVALALLLVVAAGLMVRSFLELRAVDPGFTPEGVLAAEYALPEARYPERDDVLAFQDRIQQALAARPGIEEVGSVGQLPLAGRSWTSGVQAEGWPPERVGFEIVHRRADRGYFEALDIPLLQGRLFGPDDGPDAPLVVVINETLARMHFPGEDPVGQRIAYSRTAAAHPDDNTWYEIVGVVGDQHQESPGSPVQAEVFEHRRQDWGRNAWLVARVDGTALDALPTLRSVLREMDPQLPFTSVQPLRQVWRASMEREAFILSLLTVFGGVALLLATVGVYGVSAQAARIRTREIGIRMALGAGGADVLRMVLRQSLGLVALGLALGLLASLAAGRALGSLLFGVTPTDPATLASVVALLGAAGAAACYLPARRATTVDPVRSLRAE